jgi:hypothetical protein
MLCKPRKLTAENAEVSEGNAAWENECREFAVNAVGGNHPDSPASACSSHSAVTPPSRYSPAK